MPRFTLNNTKLIIIFSIFIMAFGNAAFFSNITETYPVNFKNSLFLLSLVIVFTSATIALFLLVCNRYTIKPVLYTDYFLSVLVNTLKGYREKFDASMLYVSDHGESLGEKGLYLHGLPYFFAPDEQKKVPMLARHSDTDKRPMHNSNKRTQLNNKVYSHDHLFHTLPGLFNIKTSVYKNKMDMFVNAK